MKFNPSWVKVVFATLGIVSVGAPSFAHAQYSWSGAVSNDPSVNGNYTGGTAPTLGTSNSQGVWTTASVAMDFTTAGTTILGTGTSVSSLNWQGQGSNSTVNVTAGTVDYGGAWGNDAGIESIWVGNGSLGSFQPGVTAILSLNGGNVIVANGTILGRDGSTGNLSVTSGSFTTGVYSSAVGMFVGGSSSLGNVGAGLVTIGNGGLVAVSGAAADPFSFSGLSASANNTSSSFIDFTLASTGVLQLNLSGATLGSSYFTALVDDGYVEVGGVVDTNTSDFTMNTGTSSASTLELVQPVSVPEPSAWAMMLGGIVTLGFIARRRITS